MKTQRTARDGLFLIVGLAGGLFLLWRFLPAILFVPFLLVLIVLAATCGGLSVSEWRRELEPLLPEGVTIVDSRGGDCGLEFHCGVTFLLDHDGIRYAEHVADFESAMLARGWTKVGGVSRDDVASASFTRRGIKVSFKLLSLASSQRCFEAFKGTNASCESALSIRRDRS
jgi:hypothetical protein